MLYLFYKLGSLWWVIFKGPLEAVVGVIYGIIFGLILWYIPHKDNVSMSC